jgi:hypothetical protein
MAGLKTPLQDILTRLATIQVVNQDHNTVNLYARIWNNHLRFAKDGKGYDWPRPAAFVEIVSPVTFDIIGLGFRSADIGVKIHLIHEYYNQDGTFEQDLTIFDLRDQILSAKDGLSQYCPTACGPLNCIGEEQDFDHDNLYHYVLNFICNFTDSKGSKYDPATGFYIETADANMDQRTDLGNTVAPPAPKTDYFIIP